MASNVRVVSTDLRQATIKTSPGKYLHDVLDEACRKFHLSSDKFQLKHKQRQLDLSNTIRDAGLPPGARLELVARSKSPSVLTVALQLPEAEAKACGSSRAVEKLPSDYTFWKILRHFEEGQTLKAKNIKITGRGFPHAVDGKGQLYYETPFLQVERRTLSTFVDFQKTLSQLGYNSGSVMIRLTFQRTEQPLVDAMSDISKYFEKEHAEQAADTDQPSTADERPAAGDGGNPGPVAEAQPEVPAVSPPSAQELEQSRAEAEAMDVDPQLPDDPLAPVAVYSTPSSQVPVAVHRQEPDDVYEPGIVHAQLHQQRLKTAGQNRRLKSDAELDEERAAKEARLSAMKTIRIKVRFPDNSSGEWQFGPNIDGQTLYRAVRQVMVSPEAPIKLVIPVQIVVRDDTSNLIRTHQLDGAVLMNCLWGDTVSQEVKDKPFLKESVARQARDVVVPDTPEAVEDDAPVASVTQSSEQPRQGRSDNVKKIPKWLKGFGKK